MSNTRLILVGIAMAAVAALLVGLLQSLASPDQTARTTANRQQIVASRDLPAGRKLVMQDLAWGTVAEGREPGLTASADAIGRALVAPLAKGESLREDNLTTRLSGPAIANMLPGGHRAITVNLRDTGPEVVLYPGATVDVLATFEVASRGATGREALTRTVLEAAKVLAVNDDAVGGAVNDVADRRVNSRRLAVTLAVTPQQAADLELASSRATLGIALRSEQDKNVPDKNTGTTAVATTTSVFGAEWARIEGDAAKASKPADETVAPAPAPAPVVAPVAPAWEMTIQAGERSERRSFPSKSSN
jgi:pilus assembly protein CpaB